MVNMVSHVCVGDRRKVPGAGDAKLSSKAIQSTHCSSK